MGKTEPFDPSRLNHSVFRTQAAYEKRTRSRPATMMGYFHNIRLQTEFEDAFFDLPPSVTQEQEILVSEAGVNYNAVFILIAVIAIRMQDQETHASAGNPVPGFDAQNLSVFARPTIIICAFHNFLYGKIADDGRRSAAVVGMSMGQKQIIKFLDALAFQEIDDVVIASVPGVNQSPAFSERGADEDGFSVVKVEKIDFSFRP